MAAEAATPGVIHVRNLYASFADDRDGYQRFHGRDQHVGVHRLGQVLFKTRFPSRIARLPTCHSR